MKRPNFFSEAQQKTPKKERKKLMNAINFNVSISENEISYSKINGSENNFMNNLYEPRLLRYEK